MHILPTHPAYLRFYRRWLKTAMVLVLLMVAVGGLTRLTESGLSIVQWKLVTGILPPMTEAGWQQEFAEYKTSPEFQKKNNYMELGDFQRIYWLEYLHRLLGRVIGLVFLAPLIWQLVKRDMPRWLSRRNLALFGLVCAQGAAGWYMVKSGLVDDPWVSPYRLAFHLSLATLLLGMLYWTAQRLRRENNGENPDGWRVQGRGVLALIAVQIVLGAFVAGLDAGYTYNTFPLMDGQFIPPHMWMLEPWYRNLLEHIPAVQFIHRWFAFVVLGALIWQCYCQRSPESLHVLLVAAVQVVLGIATLLSVVDITLASLHQLTAMALVLMQLRYMSRRADTATRPANEKPVGASAII